MSKEDLIEIDGIIKEVLIGGKFRVQSELADDESGEIIAYLGGKIRKNRIRIVLGDHVTVAVSPYDMSKGRIVYRKR